jgi:23S rRNA (cytosine1962-C5)-methyltransferase
MSRPAAVSAALGRRVDLLDRLHAEDTDCYRLFHGATEGAAGVTVDRYGPLLLVQTFRDPLEAGELEAFHAACQAAVGLPLVPVWNHRGGARAAVDFARWHDPGGPVRGTGRELGLAIAVAGRHRGLDPLHFLDFRVARRWIRANAAGKDVLNLFAYTCTAGLAAAAGGARSVANVDFAESALAVGRQNARLNALPAPAFAVIHADFFVAARQLAGLPVKGRGARRRRFPRIEPRQFDLTILDPPTFAKSPFGTVDLVRDYPSVLKPALLATRPGGVVLAANHVSTVSLDDWLDVVRRSASKAGRPIRCIEVLEPEADFPSPDGAPPLKLAVLHLASVD